MISSNELLAYLALKYQGDYGLMMEAIKQKERIDELAVKEALSSIRYQYLTIVDAEYPAVLQTIYQPPLVLFYYGNLSLLKEIDKVVAVVGSRKPSSYGLAMTRMIVTDLVKAGYTIVSGLAYGIDGEAHQAAMDQAGSTIAILGSGIDHCYPKEHLPLYKKIKDNHLLISEYPGLVPPNSANFPQRNRIVAGLSKGIIVTEASERSGTLITVSYALMQGKEVFCVPHVATSKSSCNRLIKEGAYLVENAQDILDVLEPILSSN